MGTYRPADFTGSAPYVSIDNRPGLAKQIAPIGPTVRYPRAIFSWTAGIPSASGASSA
jgi:hypothetical protein